MQHKLRSSVTTESKRMAGARSLWRADGMKESQFGKPIIAIANSFTQFVPGHVHLHDIGQKIKAEIEKQGCFAAEFNTIAIDDGIAMGHDGMLYSLPSRDLIADSVEYMCNAHKADALICISNCDKITPGMLMATMRLNIPTIIVSGGPMEAGQMNDKFYDLVDSMVVSADPKSDEKESLDIERIACPTCGSCSGMFTANSMNCLSEALGMALPGNGTIVATHVNRSKLFKKAASRIIEMTYDYYKNGNEDVLPRNIATKTAFCNAMKLDIAMGGSTNTVLHILAIAQEAGVDFTMKDINELSKITPNLCKVSPSSSFHVQDVNRAGGILGIMAELNRGGLIDTSAKRTDGLTLGQALEKYDIMNKNAKAEDIHFYLSAPAGIRTQTMGGQETYYKEFDRDRESGVIRDFDHAYNKDGGLAVLYGNIAKNGSIVKTAGVDPSLYTFKGKAIIFESQEAAVEGILGNKVKAGDVVIIRYEGPKGGPGMQEMLYPTSYLKSMRLDKKCALITDGRFSGGSSGLSIGHVSPEAAAGGTIALVKNGDEIEIDIPQRKLNVLISPEELKKREEEEKKKGKKAYQPIKGFRKVSKALRAYANSVSSADKGAIRIIE